jgi:antitoxin YefM
LGGGGQYKGDTSESEGGKQAFHQRLPVSRDVIGVSQKAEALPSIVHGPVALYRDMCNNLYNTKEAAMVDVTTYSEARQNLAKLLDRVVKDNEPVIVARKKRGSVVLVALSEWNSIQETLHLFSTRANARATRRDG